MYISNELIAAGAALAVLYLMSKSSAAKSDLVLSGTYLGYGNIYSPEIQGVKMYFSGWYNDTDYPDDAIYSYDFATSIVEKIIQIPGEQVADPSIENGIMYMTYSPDPGNLEMQSIAYSEKLHSAWSLPISLIPTAWLPSAVGNYVYYTTAKANSVELYRATIQNHVVVDTILCEFPEATGGFYPINVDVIWDGMKYVMAGDYWALISDVHEYCIGIWISSDGILWTEYPDNPVIIPEGKNTIARTPNISIKNQKMELYFAQQGINWWTNAIYKKIIKWSG